MLSIRNAGVSYGSTTAFADFSLEVSSGEMISIIGKSGCGKTSLLYGIIGLVPLSQGSISLEGGRKSSSIMFQQDRLLPWKTVTANVMLGMDRHALKDAQALLSSFGLAEHLHKFPGALSGGERQRTALARCLIRKPRLLLLDEPLASLDEQTREHLQDEIKQYCIRHSITMLLVTHSIQEAVCMGSRIIVMTSGGISFET